MKNINDVNRFKELASSINRAGVSDLLDYLNNSDFFEAPASAKYHNCFEGGLCSHSLHVYDNLLKLIDLYGFTGKFSEDSIKIVSLFHDISKTDFYEFYLQNRKITKPNGNTEWVQVGAYKVKELEHRLVAGDHGFNSVFILNKYIKLTEPETVAILNHHSGMDTTGTVPNYIVEIYSRYPLAFLLHLADYVSVCIDENKYLYE